MGEEVNKRKRAAFAVEMLVVSSLSAALVYVGGWWYVNGVVDASVEVALNPMGCTIVNFSLLTFGFLGVAALTIARIFINKKLISYWKFGILSALIPLIITLVCSYVVYFSFGYSRLPRGITFDVHKHIDFALNTPWLFALYFMLAGLCEMLAMLPLMHDTRRKYERRLVKLTLFYPFLWLPLAFLVFFLVRWIL